MYCSSFGFKRIQRQAQPAYAPCFLGSRAVYCLVFTTQKWKKNFTYAVFCCWYDIWPVEILVPVNSNSSSSSCNLHSSYSCEAQLSEIELLFVLCFAIERVVVCWLQFTAVSLRGSAMQLHARTQRDPHHHTVLSTCSSFLATVVTYRPTQTDWFWDTAPRVVDVPAVATLE